MSHSMQVESSDTNTVHIGLCWALFLVGGQAEYLDIGFCDETEKINLHFFHFEALELLFLNEHTSSFGVVFF